MSVFLQPLKIKDLQKLARQMLYIWYNNNNKQTHNKNKTYRL